MKAGGNWELNRKPQSWTLFYNVRDGVGVLATEHFHKPEKFIEEFFGTFDDACSRAKEIEEDNAQRGRVKKRQVI